MKQQCNGCRGPNYDRLQARIANVEFCIKRIFILNYLSEYISGPVLHQEVTGRPIFWLCTFWYSTPRHAKMLRQNGIIDVGTCLSIVPMNLVRWRTVKWRFRNFALHASSLSSAVPPIPNMTRAQVRSGRRQEAGTGASRASVANLHLSPPCRARMKVFLWTHDVTDDPSFRLS